MTSDLPLSRISDDELQARIDRFAEAMLGADVLFHLSGKVEYRAQRDAAWVAKRRLLQERSRRQRLALDQHDEREIVRLQEENAALRQAIERGDGFA